MFKFRRPRNEEANVELQRSNSLPLSRRDPSITFMDDTNIQVIISSDRISNPNHGQTPEEATPAAASHDNENIGVNVMATEDKQSKGFFIQDLYKYAFQDNWNQAQSIYDEFPDMVRIPLTASGDTALHVAVKAYSNTFAQELVNLMTPEDLEIPNADGNTAFCMAAITGNGDFFQIMIEKNGNLPVIPGHNDMLPVHWAALTGNRNIVQNLSSQILIEKMALKDIERLFFMTISSSMYDVATKLFEKYRAELAIARDDQGLTALHMLARKHSSEFCMQQDNKIEASSGGGHPLELLKKLWSEVRQLEYKMILELKSQSLTALFDAVKSGNVEVVKWLLRWNPELMIIKDPDNGQSLLHYAVFYRKIDIFNFLLKMGKVELIKRDVDKDGNNVLHFAADQPAEASSSLRPNIHMSRELEWLEEVEKKVPPELMQMRNRDGKTPIDILNAKYKKFSDKVKDSTKESANSGMVVATLVATITFAAALTVPGEKTNAWFIVFILTNAVALFTSSVSIFSFLSSCNLSGFTLSDFILLQGLRAFGFRLLFISIPAMVIAFTAASFLIFDHISKWVPYVVASMGLIVTIFMWLFKISFHGKDILIDPNGDQ